LDKQFIIHIINKLDQEANEVGWAVMDDVTGCGLETVDMELTRLVCYLRKLV